MEDLHYLFDHFLRILLQWRLAISLFLSIALALLLSSLFAWFTAGYCITLVIGAAAFGIIWHSRGSVGIALTDTVPETPISNPVAFMGFVVIGLFWGAVAAALLNSSILAAFSLVGAVALFAAWFRWVLKRTVSFRFSSSAAFFLLLGYGFFLLLKFPNA